MVNFKYSLTLASLMYGVESNNEDDLIEIGLVAFRFIGNKRVRLYKAQLPVINGIVDLPCNADIIEAITLAGEDFNITSNLKNFIDVSSKTIEEYIESRKKETNPLYLNGRFVHYTRVGNQIHIDPSISTVNVLYWAEQLDEDGLPEITDAEALAIAAYIAYTFKYKEAIQFATKISIQVVDTLQKDWLKKCTQARVPEHLDQNIMDEVLDVLGRWPNKTYARSYKPVL